MIRSASLEGELRLIKLHIQEIETHDFARRLLHAGVAINVERAASVANQNPCAFGARVEALVIGTDATKSLGVGGTANDAILEVSHQGETL